MVVHWTNDILIKIEVRNYKCSNIMKINDHFYIPDNDLVSNFLSYFINDKIRWKIMNITQVINGINGN